MYNLFEPDLNDLSPSFRDKYREHYLSIYKNIANDNDLVIFLNCNVRCNTTIAFETIIKWIKNRPTLRTY